MDENRAPVPSTDPEVKKTYLRRPLSLLSSENIIHEAQSSYPAPLLEPVVSMTAEEEKEMCRRIRLSIKKGSTATIIAGKKKTSKKSHSQISYTSVEKTKLALLQYK